MNGWSALDRFLRTDPGDVGCAEAVEMLHIYVDLVASGAPAKPRYPASPRTCATAVRADRTSKRFWPRCAARRTDRHIRDSRPAAPDRGHPTSQP